MRASPVKSSMALTLSFVSSSSMRSYECNQEFKLLHSFLHTKSRHCLNSLALCLSEWLDSSLTRYVVASDKNITICVKHSYNIHGTEQLPCGSSLQVVAMNSLASYSRAMGLRVEACHIYSVHAAGATMMNMSTVYTAMKRYTYSYNTIPRIKLQLFLQLCSVCLWSGIS